MTTGFGIRVAGKLVCAAAAVAQERPRICEALDPRYALLGKYDPTLARGAQYLLSATRR